MEREPELFDELGGYNYSSVAKKPEFNFQADSLFNKNYFIQPNSITKAIHNMSVYSKRIIMMACSMLLERKNSSNFKVEFRLDAVIEALNLAAASEKLVENAVEAILDQKIKIHSEDGTASLCHWFVEAEYSLHKNLIHLEFNPMVAKSFVAYLEGESTTTLDVYENFTGKYSVKMYELCWAYRNLANNENNKWKTPLIKVSEIRNLWQIDDSKYPMMSDFKKRVFDVAEKEINEYANSRFTIEKIEDVKEGKKIIGWYFHCQGK